MTGASGLLGGRLVGLLGRRHEVFATRHLAPAPPGVPQVPMDLLCRASIQGALEAVRPDCVLHSAALADADRCERLPRLAVRLNAEATAALAELCRQQRIHLVALSTDLVFDGTQPWAAEEQPVDPILCYGRTKLAAERAALEGSPGAAVVRVALICGRGHGSRPTASESIAWALRGGSRPRLFVDQFRTPVDAESIGPALERLAEGGRGGLFHLGGAERLSRYQLGLRVAKTLGFDSTLIEPVRQSEGVPTAPRPLDVSLDSRRARRELGYAPRPLELAIAEGRLAPDDDSGSPGASPGGA